MFGTPLQLSIKCNNFEEDLIFIVQIEIFGETEITYNTSN